MHCVCARVRMKPNEQPRTHTPHTHTYAYAYAYVYPSSNTEANGGGRCRHPTQESGHVRWDCWSKMDEQPQRSDWLDFLTSRVVFRRWNSFVFRTRKWRRSTTPNPRLQIDCSRGITPRVGIRRENEVRIRPRKLSVPEPRNNRFFDPTPKRIPNFDAKPASECAPTYTRIWTRAERTIKPPN